MATLGIFSVKTFHFINGEYYTYGGFGAYISDMCEMFDQVVLVCKLKKAPPPPGFYRVEHRNLKIVTVPAWPTEAGAILVQPLVVAKGLAAMRNVDLIHARMPDWTGISGALVSRITKTPRFHQIVDDWHEQAESVPVSRKLGLGLLLKSFLYAYDLLERASSEGQLVFAQGKSAYEKHKNKSICHLVLSTAHRDKDVGSVYEKFNGEIFQIIAVGRLNTVKNHQLLIRALAILRTSSKKWHLRIAGQGSQKEHLVNLAKQLGVSSYVDFVGNIQHGEKLWSFYDSADVFVLPSVSEGTPKVILEAMARGCPVVASNISGVPTAVTNRERGLLFESMDLDGLVEAVRLMETDKSLRSKCQSNAIEFAGVNTVESSSRFLRSCLEAHWPSILPLKAQ